MSISKTDKGMLVLALLALLSLASIGVQAQVVREDSALFEAPDGKLTVINAKAGTPARALKRQGFWVQVEVGGKNGWIKASALSFSSGHSGPTAIDTGRMGQSNIVSTSSARGLSAKDLVSGQPNTEEVAWLESRSISTDIQAFLASGGVVAISGRIQLAAPRTAAAATAAQGSSGDTKNVPKKKNDDDW